MFLVHLDLAHAFRLRTMFVCLAFKVKGPATFIWHNFQIHPYDGAQMVWAWYSKGNRPQLTIKHLLTISNRRSLPAHRRGIWSDTIEKRYNTDYLCRNTRDLLQLSTLHLKTISALHLSSIRRRSGHLSPHHLQTIPQTWKKWYRKYTRCDTVRITYFDVWQISAGIIGWHTLTDGLTI